ncbi:6-phospho-3-hexuloisomerase [Paenarthrobacter sp. CCNWLY172]|uniref:6-phospho-3-hexuloisomerase n=1 Tax=Paenarthrobacter sp. AMU7 TaxID=3162492 RepID=A0AB39YQ90_9MICC
MDAVAEKHVLSQTPAQAALNLSLIQGEIVSTTNAIDVGQLAVLAERIRRAERVFLAGAGRSGLVLRMAAMRLMHLGLTVHVAGDTTTPAIAAGDLLVVASGSGTTSGVVKAAETAIAAGANVAAVTTNPGSPLAGLADALVIIPAAQKTDHGSSLSRQYSGSLFEQSLFLATEAVFQTLWENTDEPAEQLWLRHANLE